MSLEVKKCPSVIYRPGIGYQQANCCSKPASKPTPRNTLDGGTPFLSGLKIIDGNGSALIIDGGKP